jgi:hypothetical protein
MADEDPELKLAKLLDLAPPEDRHAITVWLLQGSAAAIGRRSWMIKQFTLGAPGKLPGVLPSGEESQLITVRLPQEQHTQLRAWCSEHNFTMAAVIRGLLERFLEEEGAAAGPEAEPEVGTAPEPAAQPKTEG